jgi:hypothetical protein
MKRGLLIEEESFRLLFAAPDRERHNSDKPRGNVPGFSLNYGDSALGSVEIHLEFMTAAARWMFAAKL